MTREREWNKKMGYESLGESPSVEVGDLDIPRDPKAKTNMLRRLKRRAKEKGLDTVIIKEHRPGRMKAVIRTAGGVAAGISLGWAAGKVGRSLYDRKVAGRGGPK